MANNYNFISIASMILGAVAAIVQKNLKRLLAYSSIGHVGYALAGVATGVASGYESAVVYISIYVIMNIGAFSCLYLMKKMENIKKIFQICQEFQKTSSAGYFLFDNSFFL